MPEQIQTFDAAVVGAGFSGLYMLYRLRSLGLSARVYEAGSGVGGTWFWNRYPGARCDIESLEYSYSFSEELEKEWQWTERYASQPEILRYINHVADRFDLRRDIQLETRVISASFDEDANRWNIRTSRGEQVSARFCIMATGCLSTEQVPDIAGLRDFRGNWYHTGRWPHEGVDFSGRRVAVIGTGSSAIQSIPMIARQAAHLYVFQRTATFSVPAQNVPLPPVELRDWKANSAAYRRKARESGFGFVWEEPGRSALEVPPEERERAYESKWERGGLGMIFTFADLITDKAANDTAAEFIRSKIRQTVQKPSVAEALSPKEYPVGTKRLCVDTGYYATFNRDNVTLVDLKTTPIERVTPSGIRTSKDEYTVDDIVFATGFDAMTGTLCRMDIRGRGGIALKEKWADGPLTYLGLMVAGFPNLFIITGPGSPSVISNMMVSIEQHVEWIAACLQYLGGRDLCAIEATKEAEDAWVAHVGEVAGYTLFPQQKSWYTGGNIPGKPRVFMPYVGGVGAYRKKCDDVAANGYEGFRLSALTDIGADAARVAGV
jgi:cation diffusion facilitator CzcD-associated flavoprotein CzcO